jgi:NADH-quinone oxidoreductase subunit G
MSDTALAADVVLPGFTFAESAGTYTNNEGRVQRVRPIYPPPAQTIMNVARVDNSADVIDLSQSQFKAKRDTDIFSEIASIMGKDLRLNSLESVFGEIAKAVPAYRSIDVSQLGDNGSFTKTPPHTLGEKPPPIRSYSEQEANNAGSDDSAKTFNLITGNCLFHSAYLTEYSPTLTAIADQPYVELNDQDASALGLQDQGRVTVSNPNHAVTLRVKCNKQFPKGVAFIPENFKHIRLNRFIQNNEYPCAVRIQAALPDNVQAQTVIAENSDGHLLGGLECDE